MALRLVEPPTHEPLTLEEAKAHARITWDTEDLLLQSYVMAARVACENFQRRSYLTQTWELTLDAFPDCTRASPHRDILLPRPPVQSVASVVYVAEDGTETTMDEADYLVDTDSEPGRLRPAYDTDWPATRAVPSAVRVRFVCGYGNRGTDVPESARMAMRFFLAHYDANREAVVTGTIATKMPLAAESLLWPDRIFGGES